MKTAVLQSNYIPWKGYFDIIHDVDEFILYDEVQYTKNDWRNRNIIKTPQGKQWIAIPIMHTGKFGQKINESQISDSHWASKHWKTLQNNYAKAPYFKKYASTFENLYGDLTHEKYLSKINHCLLTVICSMLGIETKISRSEDYSLREGKIERLIGLCQDSGATIYISGPAAKNYIDEALFIKSGIEIIWKNYFGYPEYKQLFPPFEHGVSIMDLIFNTGPRAPYYIWGWREDT